MAYCKRCVCGHLNIYEHLGGAPLRCTQCSRFIAAVTEEVYDSSIRQEPESVAPQEKFNRIDPPKPHSTGFAITLESPEGDLVLPVTEPLTVGRNAAGKDYLVSYADVSREHFVIEPRSNGISATLTDISRHGTFVNGVRMVKGTSIAVSNSALIRLGVNACLVVRVKEVIRDD